MMFFFPRWDMLVLWSVFPGRVHVNCFLNGFYMSARQNLRHFGTVTPGHWYYHETLRNHRGDTRNDDFWYTCVPDFIASIKSSGTMRDTKKRWPFEPRPFADVIGLIRCSYKDSCLSKGLYSNISRGPSCHCLPGKWYLGMEMSLASQSYHFNQNLGLVGWTVANLVERCLLSVNSYC